MWEIFTSLDSWIALITLTALELVLGIDNIIFISILVQKLPAKRRETARRTGLFLAMFMRIGLLFTLTWLIGLTAPLFSVLGNEISGRDIILMSGGLFLLWKSTTEIHHMFGPEKPNDPIVVKAILWKVILQITLVDLVFSLDSIITAVGMVEHLSIMIVAVVLSISLMMLFAPAIGRFVDQHPTIKMLALSFLVVIGVVLISDGLGHHVPKGYIYFAMAFSVIVEMLNIRLRKRTLGSRPYTR